MCVGNNIPIDWETKKLKNLLCLLKDGTHGSHKDSEYGKFLLSAKDVVAGKVLYSDESRIISNKDFDTIHAKYKLQDKDIVLTIVGTVGRAALIRGYNNEYTFQRSVAILRTNEQILPDFLYNQIQSSAFQNELKKRQSISAQPGVYLEELANIPCVVPPLEEQEKIAQILATWDSAIEQLTDLIAEKQHQKKALMQRLLTGKQRLPGFNKPWKNVRLCDIGKITSAGVDKKIIEGEKKVRLLNYMDVYRNTFVTDGTLSMVVSAPEKKIKNCNLNKGDIFFTPSSETRDDIAHSAVVVEDIKDSVYSYHIIRLRLTQNMNLFFSGYIFDTDAFYKQAYRLCEGSGQRYVLSQDYFRNMCIYMPSDINEQKAIADVLMAADAEIDLLQQQLQAIAEQKQGLMQQLLTGNIRVKIDKKS